jgi:hypothetical protein
MDGVDHLIRNLQRMSRSRPHPLVFTYLRVFLNGVATSARMQGGQQPCLMCSWHAGDRAEHLLHCTSLSGFVRHHFPNFFVWAGPVLRNRAFSMRSLDPLGKLVCDFCVFAHVVHLVHNSMRHGATSTPDALVEARLAAPSTSCLAALSG